MKYTTSFLLLILAATINFSPIFGSSFDLVTNNPQSQPINISYTSTIPTDLKNFMNFFTDAQDNSVIFSVTAPRITATNYASSKISRLNINSDKIDLNGVAIYPTGTIKLGNGDIPSTHISVSNFISAFIEVNVSGENPTLLTAAEESILHPNSSIPGKLDATGIKFSSGIPIGSIKLGNSVWDQVSTTQNMIPSVVDLVKDQTQHLMAENVRLFGKSDYEGDLTLQQELAINLTSQSCVVNIADLGAVNDLSWSGNADAVAPNTLHTYTNSSDMPPFVWYRNYK